MISKTTQLKEVIVNKYPEINSVSLGISKPGIKKYTPAERRLKTAGDFKPIHLLGLLGGHLEVDPILNAISGRTKMLKKELEVEKKEHLLLLLEAVNSNDAYVINKLNIPEGYLKGFYYHCIEDKSFVAILKSKNKTRIEFKLIEVAAEYKKLLADETK